MNLFEIDNLTDRELDEVIGLVHRYTGITMNSSKRSLLQGRIRPRLREIGLKSYKEYLDFLKENSSEKEFFIDLCTTNETYFFRTQRVWDYFEHDFLKKWYEKNPHQKLKIWSGASSSGEEVYTIGILCEKFKKTHPHFQYEITGSDISNEILAKAQMGIYQGRSIEAFRKNHPALFNEMMKSEDQVNYQVLPSIRANINLKKHNLFNAPIAIGNFDIVFLRNVLIYFKGHDQEIVLKNIYQSLKSEGILILGESESLTGLTTHFKYVTPLVYKT